MHVTHELTGLNNLFYQQGGVESGLLTHFDRSSTTSKNKMYLFFGAFLVLGVLGGPEKENLVISPNHVVRKYFRHLCAIFSNKE